MPEVETYEIELAHHVTIEGVAKLPGDRVSLAYADARAYIAAGLANDPDDNLGLSEAEVASLRGGSPVVVPPAPEPLAVPVITDPAPTDFS